MKNETSLKTPRTIQVVILIVVLLLYFSIGFSYEVYRAGSPFIDVSDTHDMLVDGADFSLLVMLLGNGVNGIMFFISQGLYAIIILIVSALFVLPFGLIGLSKKHIVTPIEYVIYKYSLISVFILSLVISAILTKFTYLLTIIFYNSIWAIFMIIFVVLPAKKLSNN